MATPNDPVMLMSYLNTKLRDEYESLNELCRSMGLEKAQICEKIEQIGYVYSLERNQFVCQSF